jgi:NAD(P)-dependent dehydrogenase (short-subunit alcohol dehydrogenase family)
MLLEDKVALVTGGASGLGEVTARLFAEHGAVVVVADVRDSEGHAVVQAIRANGARSLYAHADVRSMQELEAAVSLAERECGRLDIVVANAGILGKATFRRTEEIGELEWLEVMDVNLNGTFRTFRAAIPALLRAGGGALSATSSVAASFASCYLAAYSASKGGINALVRALAIELAPEGIRVNAVCPGQMPTNISTSLERGSGDPGIVRFAPVADAPSIWSTDGWKSRVIREGRDGTLDVAKIHLFLCSDLAAYVNGEAINADGGFSIWNGV